MHLTSNNGFCDSRCQWHVPQEKESSVQGLHWTKLTLKKNQLERTAAADAVWFIMSVNLSKLHSNLDGFYAKGYLDTWCTNVRPEWTDFLHRAFTCIIPTLLSKVSHFKNLCCSCHVLSQGNWLLGLGCRMRSIDKQHHFSQLLVFQHNFVWLSRKVSHSWLAMSVSLYKKRDFCSAIGLKWKSFGSNPKEALIGVTTSTLPVCLNSTQIHQRLKTGLETQSRHVEWTRVCVCVI